MTDSADPTIPIWTHGAFDVFIPPQWPLDFPAFGPREWDQWILGAECAGLWELQDPFPQCLASMWDEMVRTKFRHVYFDTVGDVRKKAVREWEGRFGSPLAKLEWIENSLLNPRLRHWEPAPTTDHYLGAGQFVRLHCWRPANCLHPEHPQEGCEFSPREVVPVLPKRTMNYWAAQLEDGNRVFQAVLEAPLRCDFASRGPVEVCWAQQILQLFLHKAARKLKPTWDALPVVIARAQLAGALLRAHRPQEY